MLSLGRPYFLAIVFTVFSFSTAQRYKEAVPIGEVFNKYIESAGRSLLESDKANHPEDLLPSVNFQCKGRPAGYYADPQFGCEVFHYCHKDGTRVTIVCSEDQSNKHKICQFRNIAVKACGESDMYFVLPEILTQKKGKGTTAAGMNDATDFKLPLVIPRPTVPSYVASHPTKPLRTESRDDNEEESHKKSSPLIATRKASSPFRLSSYISNSPKANVFEPYTPIRIDLKDGGRIFEVFTGSGRFEKLHSDAREPVAKENIDVDESNNENLQSRLPLKQKRIQILKTIFPSGVDKTSKIHLRLSSKKPKTYFENPGYQDNKTDYKQYYIAKPGVSKSNGGIYLIEVYHKDFDNDPVGDYSSYQRRAKNVSFLLSSEKSELKEALTKPKAKKTPRRKKRMVANVGSNRRPFAVIYAKVPSISLQEGDTYPTAERSRNQDQENIQVSISPNRVHLDLSPVPITIHSPQPQESPLQQRNNQQASSSRHPKSAVIYDNSAGQPEGQQFSEQRNVYYVSPEQFTQNSGSPNPKNGNNILRSIVNPSYRITEDQQADPAEAPSRLHTENKTPGETSRQPNNVPLLNTFNPAAQQGVHTSESGPKLLNPTPQNIPYFRDPTESHYFLDPQGIIQNPNFPSFIPFGNQGGFVSGRPLQDQRIILNPQHQDPVPKPQRLPSAASQNANDGTITKESNEGGNLPSIDSQSSNSQNSDTRTQGQTTVKRQPTFGLPPDALHQAVFSGYSPFVPHEYGGLQLQQDVPLGIPPFGYIATHEERPAYPVPNTPQQFRNDRRPQLPFRGSTSNIQNTGRPNDSSSSEENTKEHNGRYNNDRNQRGRYLPQQGTPQQSRPNVGNKPDSSEERTHSRDNNRNINKPNYQQFTPQDVRPTHLNAADVNLGIPQNYLQRPLLSQSNPNVILPQGLLHQPHPRPFEVSEANRGVPNEQFQGLPPPNRLSQVQRPPHSSFSSEEEIKSPGDYNGRPPYINSQNNQNTRSNGPLHTGNGGTHNVVENYHRRPTLPTAPESQIVRPHHALETQGPKPHRPFEAEGTRPYRPSESQSSRPYRPTEVQSSRPQRPPEIQNPRPYRPPEVQNPRQYRPSETQNFRPQNPSHAQNNRQLRPSEVQSSRTQRQPFNQGNGNIRTPQEHEGIPHRLNKYAPEDERVLIHQNPYNNGRDNTGIRDDEFQRGPPQSSSDDYRPNRYSPTEERPPQKQNHNTDNSRSYVNPNYPISKPVVPSSENQVHYGHRNPSSDGNNVQSRPPVRHSQLEYANTDLRKPPRSSYSSPVNQEEKTSSDRFRAPSDEYQKPKQSIPPRDHNRQRQNGNQGNSVNVVSSAGNYRNRPYHPRTSSETPDDQNSYADNHRYSHLTERPEAVRRPESITRDGPEPEYDARPPPRVYKTQENDYDKNKEPKSSHRDDLDSPSTRPPDPTTRPPARRKPTPPRPTFPSFPTFPAAIRRPIPTIPTTTEDEISHSKEDIDVDPNAHMRARQNSRPRIAPTVSTISYSTNIGPYLPEDRNELLRETSKPPTTSPRQRPRKRAKGRVRRPKPTARTTTDGIDDEPLSTTSYSDKKGSFYDDKKYDGRSEYSTVKPEPLSTSYSTEVEITTKTDGYGNRINLFSRQLNRRPSTFKQRFSTTTPISVSGSDGSVKKITAVPITRRRRPYKKRVRAKSTTTTESPTLTESESIARSDEEIESLLYIGQETTLIPTESTVLHEVTSVLPESTEPITLPTTTAEEKTPSESGPLSNLKNQDKVPADGGKRSVLNKFKSRPRLLRFGRPRPRSGTEEPTVDNAVAESRTSSSTVSEEVNTR